MNSILSVYAEGTRARYGLIDQPLYDAQAPTLSWPVEAIPPIMRLIGRVFPSEAAIDGMVRINQMGASLGEVSKDWISLLGLGLAYYLLAVLGTHLRRPRLAHAV